MVPGVISKETVEFAARHAYPYIALGTTVEDTRRIWDFYSQVAAEAGYEAGPEHRGYLMRCTVAETEKEALERARQYLWMAGEFTGVGRFTWANPTGYTSFDTRRGRKPGGSLGGYQGEEDFRRHLEQGTIIAGTPEQVIEKIGSWLEATRPGVLVLWASEGRMKQPESLDAIRMLGERVLPEVRKMAESLGLGGPDEVGAPVSLAAGPPRQPASAVSI